MEKLVSTILDGAMGDGHWNRALDAICREIGAAGGVIQADDADHKRRHIYGLSQFFREGEGAVAVDNYMRGEDRGDEEGYRALASITANKMVLEKMIYGVKTNADMPVSDHRTLLESIGHGTRSAAVLNPAGPWYDLIALTFPTEEAGERSLSHPSIPLVLGLVSKTIELQRIMSTLRQRYSAALAALDHLGLGVVLANSNAEILLINNEAQRILDARDGLSANTKRQLVAAGDVNARLQTAIRTAITEPATHQGPTASPINILRPSAAYDFLISVSPLRDTAAELEPNLQAAFVMIVDPARSGSLDASGLALLGRLTSAESDVATHLVSGRSVQEIASLRETSPLTVRGQIKSVGSKLRCRSQSDIIRLAAVTRLPIIDDEA